MPSELQAKTHSTVEESIAELLEKLPEGPLHRDLVRKAYEVAERLHRGVPRKSGEPYIAHPVAVAQIMASLNMDAASLAASLLHDVLEDTDYSMEELKADFPEPVPALVDAVTKISKMKFTVQREAQIENLRRMIMAMARDIRVIILKLCDRLHNMRTLEALPEPRQRAIAKETLDLYAPLANRLGIVKIKVEMEDLAMRYLHPEEYSELRDRINARRADRDARVERSCRFLRNYLVELGYDKVSVTGRSKHFFSIYRKMRAQGLSFDEIHDLNAIRVICEDDTDCYAIMGHIHSLWRPLPNRIKDYIGFPKPNHYRSLHTTVLGLDGMVTEIQIRTREMHRIAEYGIAAHWKYKEGRIDQTLDNRLAWLRQLAEWATEPGEPSTLLDDLKGDVFADEALCFTPKGDVIELPAGATPIDFAYAIHTQVGEHCVGARVNGRIVSLRHKLKHGDVVEIMTSTAGHPSRDWLDAARTNRARSKIKRWLKSSEMEKWVHDGRAALERLIRERNLEVTKAELEAGLQSLLEPFQMRTHDDVLAEIGFGAISPQAALARMNPDWSKPRRRGKALVKEPIRQKGAVLIDGMDGISPRFANCCTPVPGDDIVAFVTRGRGITIHKAECANLARQRAANQSEDRVIPAAWNTSAPLNHTVTIRLEAFDRKELLADLTQSISRSDAYIVSCQTRSDRSSRMAFVRFEVDISDISQLDKILSGLRDVKSVTKVERSNRAL